MRGTRSYKRKTLKKKGGMFDRATSIARSLMPMTPAAEEAAEIRKKIRDEDEKKEFDLAHKNRNSEEYNIVRDPNAGNWAKSYCCNKKESSWKVAGGDNVGTKCTPSRTGICYPWQSKFKCFDPQNVNLHKIKEGTDDKGNRYPGECQIISGVFRNVAKGPTAVIKTAALPLTMAFQTAFGEGGKKRRSNKTKKGTRRKSRRHRRSRSR